MAADRVRVLISNTDDHLRNHGFLRKSTAGWSLSPAFDLNPNPRRRDFSTSVSGGDARHSIAGAIDVAPVFRLTPEQAQSVLEEVISATSGWRAAAGRIGTAAASIDQLAPAFEDARA